MITVYTKPGCKPCEMTCRQLTKMGVPHVLVDATEDEAGMESVRSLGYREMPVVVTEDDHWSGFRPDKLDELGKRQWGEV